MARLNSVMPYDMNPLFNINGGWGWRGERTIARWYTQYGTIIQCRDWLPNPIGGVVWLAWQLGDFLWTKYDEKF